MHQRRNTFRIALLLLPLLTLRLLLPPGYMLAGGGDLRLVMCSAGLMLPEGEAHSETHSEGDDDGQPGPAAFDCPFANVQVSAPAPHFISIAIPATTGAQALREPARALPPPTGPPRTDAARAPPGPFEERLS